MKKIKKIYANKIFIFRILITDNNFRKEKFMNRFLISTILLSLTGTAQVANSAGGFVGPSVSSTTVAEAAKMTDDTPVVLVGNIEKKLGNELYQFSDKSGSIIIEIDNEDWNGLTVKPEDTVEISGEVDKELMKDVKIEVDSISLKK